MDKIVKIKKLCKCSILLDIDPHKDYYQSTSQYFQDKPQLKELIDRDVYDEMCNRNTIINLHFYPRTPIGSYNLYHYDLDSILIQALRILEEQND